MRRYEPHPGSAAGLRLAGRALLIGVAVLYLTLFLVLPLLTVFVQALAGGIAAYVRTLTDADTLAAMRLTLTVAAISVPLNTVFGTAAAWAISKYEFRGKGFLLTLIDLPFAVSPVIAGLIFVLVFGARGWLGGWLGAHDFRVIFALPGMVLATTFITFPFIARELIPLM